MNPIDDLRPGYKAFIDSPVGRDFLTRILAYETQLQMENYRDATNERKLSNIDKMTALYWVRTLLGDLAKPKPTPSVKKTKDTRVAQ